MAQNKKYTCWLGALRLCVRQKEGYPKKLDVRVVQKPNSPFQRALTIRPGTVLKLISRSSDSRFVRAKVFVPRIHYGHLVAGGVVEIF